MGANGAGSERRHTLASLRADSAVAHIEVSNSRPMFPLPPAQGNILWGFIAGVVKAGSTITSLTNAIKIRGKNEAIKKPD